MKGGDLEARRRRVIEFLAEQFAIDALDLEEYERRADLAQRADTLGALQALIADLDTGVVDAPEAMVPVQPASSTALVSAEQVPHRRSLVAVFSSVSRKRGWTVPRRLSVVSVFGEAEVDFRQAQLGVGVTEVQATAVLGSVHIIVPPDLPVQVDGSGVLGEFDEANLGDQHVADAAASLRIKGLAVLGKVEIEDRLEGESKREAKKRRRQQARQR